MTDFLAQPYQHPAYWLLRQLNRIAPPDSFINFRAIVDHPPKNNVKPQSTPVFNENVAVTALHERWPKLLAHFVMLNLRNEDPANIYFGVNPRRVKNASGNKIADICGYTALYLDCDDNAYMTIDQRLLQLQFWRDIGFPPSATVFTGHGFHPYWFLTEMAPCSAQPLLKRMVQFSMCSHKGNTHDPTRVLRLPGFRNVKYWYNNDTPEAVLQEANELRHNIDSLDWYFPPSSVPDIERYRANAINLGEGTVLSEKLQNYAHKCAEAARSQYLQNETAQQALLAVDRMQAEAFQAPPLPGNAIQAAAAFTPTRPFVPAIDDIVWPKKRKWLKKYCLKGLEGLTENERKTIAAELDREVSSSELDQILLCFLIRQGYTYAAVHEFYMRPSLNLARQKILEREDWLQTSYSNALIFVRAAMAQEATEAALHPLGCILEENGELCFKTRNDTQHILTGTINVITRYEDRTMPFGFDREWFELELIPSNPQIKHRRVFVNAGAFSSAQNFLTHFGSNSFRLLTTKTEVLQALLKYLEDRSAGVTVQHGYSMLGYYPADDAWILPQYKITKDSIEVRDTKAMLAHFSAKNPTYTWFTPRAMLNPCEAREFVTQNWTSLLQCHLKSFVCAVMGTLGASLFQPMLAHKGQVTDYHIPIINVRGRSCTGKSETAKHLMRLIGLAPSEITVSSQSTPFALQRTLEFAFFPLLLDEFKESNDRKNNASIQRIKDVCRRMYSGERLLRGTRDLGVVSMGGGVTTLILVGETAAETLGQVAEVSRIYPVDTDVYNTKNLDTQGRWAASKQHAWELVAPYFYQYLLSADVNNEYRIYAGFKSQAAAILNENIGGDSSRIAHNIAVLAHGCSLFDRWVHSINPELPTIDLVLEPFKTLVNSFVNYTRESQHSIVVEPAPGSIEKKQVYSNDEFFQMLRLYDELVHSRDAVYEESMIKPHVIKDSVIYMHLPLVHKLVKKAQRMKDEHFVDYAKIRSVMHGILDSQPTWITVKNKSIRLSGTVFACYGFKLSTLKEMGLWTSLCDENQAAGTIPIDEKISLF